jgi:DNA ligase-1
MPITKPLLASPVEDEQIRFPVLATPKLDGIRCLKINGEVVSRKFKPIQNEHIRKTLKKLIPEGADGEIMSGTNFQECAGNVMRRDGKSEFEYHWFDWVYRGKTDEPYFKRVERMATAQAKDKHNDARIKIVRPQLITNMEGLARYEARCLEDGYEGVMIRDPNGIYKCGRSRVSDHILLKIKRFADSEGILTAFVEMMHNENEAKKDAFGRTERSSSKDGKVPAGTLGKLLVVDDKFPDHIIELGTGQGLTHELRQEIWDNRDEYLGKLVKYKYQEAGMKDKPRFPIFLGFRHEDDMGNE